MCPVPDKTYFGETPEGAGILYGEVRKIEDEQRKLVLLKSRMDSFMVNQISNGVSTPFPLAIITFVAIETLGHIILPFEKIKANNEYERSKAITTPIYQLMDRDLIRKPTKVFYEAFVSVHGEDSKRYIDRYSDVIHKYQRNTFIHGYQAKGVFLSHELNKTWHIDEKGGLMIINPFKFWDLYKSTHEKVFSGILSGREREFRKNALKYFKSLLQ